jgi:hypothetical protein
MEFAKLADQAEVAIAGAGMINRAEPRACGYSRGSRRLDTEPGTKEPQVLRQTKPGTVLEGRRATRRRFQPYWGKLPYGMIRGGGGNVEMA